ncbi:ester cyclase [Janthinobacterium sp.]|uniref:ester cyclase n=1 Tax=Janthinobacterium sp. TaxID=1871054 RepID=UPI003918532B
MRLRNRKQHLRQRAAIFPGRKFSMQNKKLSAIYSAYLACLNHQEWENLGNYVADHVAYNGHCIGYAGYLHARQDEFRTIPDLHFSAQLLIADEAMVACRLDFNITPSGDFLGLPVNGKRISFAEHAFYEFENGKIAKVWSVLDQAAIESQLFP